MKIPTRLAISALLCLLSMQVTGAAAGTSGARPHVRWPVTIECEGWLPPVAPEGEPAAGRCTISGAITDTGRFVDHERPFVHPHARTFVGRNGTLRFSVYRENGSWMLVEGTRAYASLRGRGWERNRLAGPKGGRCGRPQGIVCSISLTMKGVFSPRGIG